MLIKMFLLPLRFCCVLEFGTGKYSSRYRRHISTTFSCNKQRASHVLQSKSDFDNCDKREGCDTDSFLHEDVSLIVKNILSKRKASNEESEVKKTQNLSYENLQKNLDAIKWDSDAMIHRQRMQFAVESKEHGEKMTSESLGLVVDSLQSDMREVTKALFRKTFPIEDVYLDSYHSDVDALRTAREMEETVSLTGRPDPSIPKSDIPCCGCGATLHCQDPMIPGFLACEKFKSLTRKEMKSILCHRCFLIWHYKLYMNVKVPSNIYPQILQQINQSRAIVVLVVDLFDMKNSIFANILRYIGTHRPLYVVGNKVDLIPKDSDGYLDRLYTALVDACVSAGLNPTGKNIRHISLVSAKTGYGIESLITRLMTEWRLKAHVYVVGSTNVGKSTLFNALLMSDYCKSKARDFISRATVSLWPGTTLNLLKFPLERPLAWKLHRRSRRLREETSLAAESAVHRSQAALKDKWDRFVLTGHVGLTDFRDHSRMLDDKSLLGQDIANFSMDKCGNIDESFGRSSLLDPGDGRPSGVSVVETLERNNVYWCYDTPGVINDRQVDLEHDCRSVYVLAYVADVVKPHIKDYVDADLFYEDYIGTDTLQVPQGDDERLNKIPSLVGKEFQFTGIDKFTAAIDIQLSTLGWVSLATVQGAHVTVRVFTPGGAGLHSRQQPFLPKISAFKGKRVQHTPFFHSKDTDS